LTQSVDTVYEDHQLIAALDKLCCFNVNDEEMIGVDVAMIKQAFTRPKGSSDVIIIPYGQVIRVESEHYLHIIKCGDVMKIACSKSTNDVLKCRRDQSIFS